MERILIADADRGVCDTLSHGLQKEGYTTRQVYTGSDAEKLCGASSEQTLDLMLLDVVLPDKDGWEVCKEVRKFSDIPIIMLISKDDMVEKVLSLEIGADDYITKPFDLREVTARVKVVLRRMKNFKAAAAGRDKKTAEYENLSVDLNRYEMKVGGKVQEAPPKELELLFFLVSNPNKVFTRDQLLDDVWGFEYYGDSRTIDVHIKRLRSKLEGASDKWALKTVWGVGYKFEVTE
ncbi:MAG: response regulator transcription factor [Oscillospiraceae bacterium]|nr:response regulator transcription factor [Oscillospiraceae bacterium]